MLAGSGLIIFIYIKESEREVWALVGVFVAFLSMFPYLNNKIFEDTNNQDPDSDPDCTDLKTVSSNPDSPDIQSGSNNPDRDPGSSDLKTVSRNPDSADMQSGSNNPDRDTGSTDLKTLSSNPDNADMQSGSNNPSSTNPLDPIHASPSGIMTEIEIVEPDGIYRPPVNASAWKVQQIFAVIKNCFSTNMRSGSNNPDSTNSSDSVHSSSSCNTTRIENGVEDGKYTPPDNASAWKVQLISAVFKILFITIATSAYFIEFALGKTDLKDALMLGWNWSTSNKSYRLFIAHIVTSLVAYVTAVFAFSTCIQRGAFLVPIVLSSPVVYTLLVLFNSCEWYATFLDQPSMFCANNINVE